MDSRRSSYVKKVRRKGGRIRWALSYIGPDGRRHQEMSLALTRHAARQLLYRKLTEVDRQRELGVQAITFAEFCRKYLAHQRSVVEPRSYERVESIVEKRLKPHFGKRLLSEIHARDIQEYLNERALAVYRRKDGTEKRIAPATVHRELQTLSGVFSRALDWDYVLRNPVRKVKIRKYESRRQRILEPEEEARLFTALRRFQRGYLADIVTLALQTGMREDEILRLKWMDVNLGNRTIIVRSTNENPNKGKRTRPVPISSKLSPILARLYMEALRATKGDPIALQDRYVFTNPETGKRYMDTKLAWYAALKDARIARLRFHDLRHTFATRALRGGAKESELQQVLGHSEITTTMRYVQMDGRNAVNVIKSLEAYEQEVEPEKADGQSVSG